MDPFGWKKLCLHEKEEGGRGVTALRAKLPLRPVPRIGLNFNFWHYGWRIIGLLGMFDESVRVTECFVASHYSRNRVSRQVARVAMNFRAIKIGYHEITYLNYVFV